MQTLSHRILEFIRPGLALRLSIVTSLLVLVGFAAMSYSTYLYVESQIQKRVEVESRELLQFAVKGLTQPLWSLDVESLNEISDALLTREPTLLAIRILSDDSRLLLEQQDTTVSTLTFEQTVEQPGSHLFEREVRYRDRNLGKIQLVISADPPLKDLNDFFVLSLILTVVFSFFVAAIIFGATEKYLGRPLGGLVQIAKDFSNGRYQIPENQNWQLEFNTLSEAFAQAAQAISRRDRELTEHAENLESQVLKRTRELDEQRMNLVNSSRLASLGEISAGIAHEINNPLAIIDGKAQILARMLTAHPEAGMLTPHLEKISQMVQRISQIIKSLRTFARDGSRDAMHTYDVDAFIDCVRDLCSARTAYNHISFQIIQTPGLRGFGREVQLSQVLINLINNSIDEVRNLEERWIRLEVFENASSLVFAVTDSGTGIPPEIRMKIMLPFFTTKDVGQGTGLGLSISSGIIRDHGGTLTYIDDSPSTRFEVRLPRVGVLRQIELASSPMLT